MKQLGVVKDHYEAQKFWADRVETDPDYENDPPAVLDAKRDARATLVKVVVGRALSTVHDGLQRAEQAISFPRKREPRTWAAEE